MKICNRCIVDETVDGVIFDQNGNCNYCNEFIEKISHPKDLKQKSLDDFIAKVKNDGKNLKYDCVVGISGGCDSSYALDLACKNGLRPIAVHLDNGWNSVEAYTNIQRILMMNKVPLHVHVIDWKENRDLQRSFFMANVVDIEMLMDNAQAAFNFKIANLYGVKYILSGTNTSTEGMRMPTNWTAYKFDKRNIIDIHRKFGRVPIKTHPLISTLLYFYYSSIKKIKWINFLDFVDYNKEEAKTYLINKYNYVPYYYKHGESVFTRLYQNYILPKKFHIDKRIIHLSTLICSNQLTREHALELIKSNEYLESALFQDDLNFCKMKLGFDTEYIENYLVEPGVPHGFYRSELQTKKLLDFLYRKIWKRYVCA